MSDSMFRLLGMLPDEARTRVVAMYVETLAGQFTLLADAVRSRGEDAVPLAHKIAGSAAMMQDHALSVPVRSLETCLRGQRWDEALEQWPEVQERIARTLALLREAYPAG